MVECNGSIQWRTLAYETSAVGKPSARVLLAGGATLIAIPFYVKSVCVIHPSCSTLCWHMYDGREGNF